MLFSDSNRRYFTIGLVLFVIVGLVTASILGKKQDVAFQTESEKYNQVVQQLQDGNYEAALEGTKALEYSRQSSEIVNYIIGLVAVNAGEIDNGIQHLQRVLDINPHKVEDEIFMLQLAEAFVLGDRNDYAQIVLEQCKLFMAPESYLKYQERVAQLEKQIVVQQ